MWSSIKYGLRVDEKAKTFVSTYAYIRTKLEGILPCRDFGGEAAAAIDDSPNDDDDGDACHDGSQGP